MCLFIQAVFVLLFCALKFSCFTAETLAFVFCTVTLQRNIVWVNECVSHMLTRTPVYLSVCQHHHASVVAPAGGMALVWYSAPRQHNETWERAAGHGRQMATTTSHRSSETFRKVSAHTALFDQQQCFFRRQQSGGRDPLERDVLTSKSRCLLLWGGSDSQATFSTWVIRDQIKTTSRF